MSYLRRYIYYNTILYYILFAVAANVSAIVTIASLFCDSLVVMRSLGSQAPRLLCDQPETFGHIGIGSSIVYIHTAHCVRERLCYSPLFLLSKCAPLFALCVCIYVCVCVGIHIHVYPFVKTHITHFCFLCAALYGRFPFANRYITSNRYTHILYIRAYNAHSIYYAG